MTSLRAFVVLAGMIGGALACGDSSGPGKSAASITGVAGDNQSASTGAQLAFPLSFTALGSNGQPIQGVSVTWSVTPTGRATFSTPSSQTDANGSASTNVTMGTVPGNITIQANVTGVSPVVYSATVLNPCEFLAAYTIGQTVNGALATTDCLIQIQTPQGTLGWYYDFYGFTLLSGQHNVRIKMRGSGSFDDTFLDLLTDAAGGVAFDDDSILGQVGARNSQLDAVLLGGDYVIGANSFDPFTTGSYTMSSEIRATPMNGCRQVWVTGGLTIADSITNSDCADSSATPRRYDVARIVLHRQMSVRLSASSGALNPTLTLYRLGNNDARSLVVTNDDSVGGTGTNAFIDYTAPDTAYVYDILIGTSASAETGAYTFGVSTSVPPSPRFSRLSERRRDSWWRNVLLSKRSKP